MKLIGLLMMRNDHDILPQVLEWNMPYFDAVYVLDGSDDPRVTRLIFSKYADKLGGLYLDSDLPATYARPPRDGARQFLLEKIQQDHSDGDWIFCLHSDEIFLDLHPRLMAIAAEQQRCDCILVRNVHFFLHTSQEGSYRFDSNLAVMQQIRFASFPGFPEYRAFKNGAHLSYEVNRHSQVIPNGLTRQLETPFPLRHYLYRHPEQMLRNMNDRFERNWQGYGKAWYEKEQRCFVDVLPGYKFAREIAPDQKILDGVSGALYPREGPDG